MAMLWFLFCLALLSEVYGQPYRKTSLDPNILRDVDRLYAKSLQQSFTIIHTCGGSGNESQTDRNLKVIMVRDENGFWIDSSDQTYENMVLELRTVFNPKNIIMDKDKNGLRVDEFKAKRRRSITSPQEESPVSLASSSDVFNNGDTCVTANVTYTCDSTNNQQGADQKSTEDTSGNSQRVNVPILTDDECQKHWGTKSQKNEICTGLSSCMVDSGAGLLCKRNGTWIMAGIALSPCYKSKPAMFTHMSAFKG